jgi:hypothetical protein
MLFNENKESSESESILNIERLLTSCNTEVKDADANSKSRSKSRSKPRPTPSSTPSELSEPSEKRREYAHCRNGLECSIYCRVSHGGDSSKIKDDDNAHISQFTHVTACSYAGNCHFMKRMHACKNNNIPCSRDDREHVARYSHYRPAKENNEDFCTPQKASREEICPPAPIKRPASTMKVRSQNHVEYKLSESDSQRRPPSAPRNINSSRISSNAPIRHSSPPSAPRQRPPSAPRQRPPTPSAPRNTNSSKPTKCLCFFGLDCIYYINFHNKVMMKNPAIAGPATDHISKFSH